ncbi:MAG TPA: hypothetical protein DCE83_10210, partial [Enterococcus sp.]|nr:hypothetical protein [Enterococcus sp.]
EGTVGACATLLTILFMIPQTESYLYAFNRIVDSFIGMTIAILVNRFFPFPNKSTAGTKTTTNESDSF